MAEVSHLYFLLSKKSAILNTSPQVIIIKIARAKRNHMIGVKPPNFAFKAAVTMPIISKTTAR